MLLDGFSAPPGVSYEVLHGRRHYPGGIALQGPALAFHPDPGFWPGYLDDLLSLLKLMMSKVIDVRIVQDHLGPWGYTAGYCLGLLTFVVGAAAFAFVETKEGEIRWG
ncbi:MAG: hypothetical protein AB7U38_14460 [Hyphomicrobiales bacterium]